MKKICLFVSLSLLVSFSHAQGVFTSTGSGNWNTTSIWSFTGSDADGVPDGNDNVTIAGTNVITLTQDESCNNITIADPSGNRLVIGSNFLNINGTLGHTVAPTSENYITSNFGIGRVSFVGSTSRPLITNGAPFGNGFDVEIVMAGSTVGTSTGFDLKFRNLTIISGIYLHTGSIFIDGGSGDGSGGVTIFGTLNLSGSLGARNSTLTTYCGTVTVNEFGKLEIGSTHLNGQTITINGELYIAGATALQSNPSAPASSEFTYGPNSTLEYINDAGLFGAETGRASGTADPIIDLMRINTGISTGIISSNGFTPIINALAFINGKISANSVIEVRGTISGESSDGYVITNSGGALRRTNIDAADLDVIFPVGPSGSLYHPATLTNSGTIDNFTVRVTSTTPSCTPAFASVTTTWDISETTPGGSNCALILNFTGSATGGAYTNSGAQIVHCNGSSVDYSNGSVTGTVATGSGFTTFSPFGITSDPFTLPAGITSFGGEKQGNNNLLRWTTASESNNLGFEVQRAADGVNFSTIGFVGSLASGGNSSTELNYNFTDLGPAGARQYYRLRQVDADSRSKLSAVVLIKGEKSTKLLLGGIYPNPVAGSDANIIVESPERTIITLSLTDISGRVISNRVLNLETGSNTLVIPVSQLRSGTYLVRVMDRNTGETTTGKLVKQ